MKENAWISSPKLNPAAKIRLFCFPYSGASASIFYSWSGLMPESIDIVPVQYPGHGTRLAEPLMTNLADIIAEAVQAFGTYFDRPFAFFGHSMGALVSFELARWLKKHRKTSPVYLFVSGHNAPHLPDMESPLHQLPQNEFIESVRTLNGTPEDVLANTELRELILPILRADFQVCETYRFIPDLLLDYPICACGGLQDSYISRDGLEAWREHTTGNVSVRLFPGDHFYLNSSKNLLLQVIVRELYRYIQL